MKKHLPNFITLLNLSSGTLGVIFILNGQPLPAAYMVFLAAVFDFLDGFAARLLKAYSVIGQSLDSLADVISFGLLPGILIYYIQKGLLPGNEGLYSLIPLSAVVIPAFSAIRLAIFNADEEQKDSFKGLPTPANALFFASITYFLSTHEMIIKKELLSFILLFFTLLMSYLLVSHLRMFSLKVKSYGFRENILVYSFLIISAAMVVFFGVSGIAISIGIYILLSLIQPLLKL